MRKTGLPASRNAWITWARWRNWAPRCGESPPGNPLGGQIRPHNVRAHGITCGAVLDRLLHLVGQVRVFDFRLFASTSGLADATSGRIIGELRAFPHAVFDGLGIASQDLGDGAGAAMAECDRFECRKASAILCREALG